jgi:vacuolar-type H+-ATPase subunit H
MPEELAPQSPEILKEIQAAERKVESMVRAAEQEAAATLDKVRAQAEALLTEKRRYCEQKKRNALSRGLTDAEREAGQLLKDAQTKARNLKARCMGRMDETVDLVLGHILPSGWPPHD